MDNARTIVAIRRMGEHFENRSIVSDYPSALLFIPAASLVSFLRILRRTL